MILIIVCSISEQWLIGLIVLTDCYLFLGSKWFDFRGVFVMTVSERVEVILKFVRSSKFIFVNGNATKCYK